MGTTELAVRGSDIDKFTDRERRFVFEYLIDLNGTRAALAAGYSRKTAPTMASRLLEKTHIRRYIGKQERLKSEEAQVRKQDLIQELVYQSFRDVIDLCDPETGHIVLDDLRKLPSHIRKCIDGIKVKSRSISTDKGEVVEQSIELKLVSKTTSQDMLMKHFGWYQDGSGGDGDRDRIPISWDDLTRAVEVDDPVEQRIKEEEGNGQG